MMMSLSLFIINNILKEILYSLLHKFIILYKFVNSNAAFGIIMFAVVFMAQRCALGSWYDNGIAKELEKISNIIN